MLNKNKLHKNQCHFLCLFKIISRFSTINKSMKKSKPVPLKSFCHISAAAENICKLSVLGFAGVS